MTTPGRVDKEKPLNAARPGSPLTLPHTESDIRYFIGVSISLSIK